MAGTIVVTAILFTRYTQYSERTCYIASRMLTGIYRMLADNKDFHTDDYEAIVQVTKQRPVILTLDNMLQFLREQGADPETLKLVEQQRTALAG